MGVPLTLGGARKVARDQLLLVSAGRDPAAEKQAAKAAVQSEDLDRDLVMTVAEQFLARYLKPRAKPNYYKSVSYILRKDVLPRWGERRIQEISRRDVLELLDAVVDRGAGVQANRVLAAVRKLFNWAVSRDVIGSNPAAGVKPPAAETSRDRILTDDDLGLLWRACDEIGYPFGPLAKLMLLTGARREEAAGLRRSELDGEGANWTLPAARTKNSRPHTVSLSLQARAAIAEAPVIAVSKADLEAGIPRHGKRRDLVFSTTGRTPVSGYTRGKLRIDEAMLAIARKEACERGDDPADVKVESWTFHDLRRTLASGMARLGIELPVIERCLNHVSGSFGGVVGVYQRHSFADEMRTAFALWGAHVEAVAGGGAVARVASLGRWSRIRK